VAVAIERNRLSEEVAVARVSAESDKLRAALLNSVSHDLRTPLVTVIGAASTLAESGEALTADQRSELTASVLWSFAHWTNLVRALRQLPNR
jgi:two-component system, OmpR family, sensor histidine kinase KdpD